MRRFKPRTTELKVGVSIHIQTPGKCQGETKLLNRPVSPKCTQGSAKPFKEALQTSFHDPIRWSPAPKSKDNQNKTPVVHPSKMTQ